MSTIRQIIGSFEDIGEQVVKEAVKLPADVAGKALESLGASSGKNPKKQTAQKGQSAKGSPALTEFEGTSEESVKKIIARRALEELARPPQKKEPTVWDEKQKEDAEKKRLELERAKIIEKQKLPEVTPKQRRGNLYGIGIKTSSERQKNVKAE
jgi:hypothetical protein